METPLHAATEANHADVVRLLLNAGADKHRASGIPSETPLEVAQQRNLVDIVHLLRDESKAEPRVRVRKHGCCSCFRRYRRGSRHPAEAWTDVFRWPAVPDQDAS